LKQNQELVAQKDSRVKELEGKLETLQFELEEKTSALEEMSAKTIAEKDGSAAEETSSMHEDTQQQKLQPIIDAYETQLQETKQTLEAERLAWGQQQEEAEEKNRENMDRLRERLLGEKEILNNTIIEKDRALHKLQKNMDEMRDNIQVSDSVPRQPEKADHIIQEMHQSHQTRLTSLASQLNQQHAKYIDQLKLDYENQLRVMNDKQAEFEKQLDEKQKVYAYIYEHSTLN
jgi:chromosome segregation ATPase